MGDLVLMPLDLAVRSVEALATDRADCVARARMLVNLFEGWQKDNCPAGQPSQVAAVQVWCRVWIDGHGPLPVFTRGGTSRRGEWPGHVVVLVGTDHGWILCDPTVAAFHPDADVWHPVDDMWRFLDGQSSEGLPEVIEYWAGVAAGSEPFWELPAWSDPLGQSLAG